MTCRLSLFTIHHLSVHESQNSILLTLPTGGVATSPFQVILSLMPAIRQSDMLILSLSFRDGRGCGGISSGDLYKSFSLNVLFCKRR